MMQQVSDGQALSHIGQNPTIIRLKVTWQSKSTLPAYEVAKACRTLKQLHSLTFGIGNSNQENIVIENHAARTLG